MGEIDLDDIVPLHEDDKYITTKALVNNYIRWEAKHESTFQSLSEHESLTADSMSRFANNFGLPEYQFLSSMSYIANDIAVDEPAFGIPSNEDRKKQWDVKQKKLDKEISDKENYVKVDDRMGLWRRIVEFVTNLRKTKKMEEYFALEMRHRSSGEYIKLHTLATEVNDVNGRKIRDALFWSNVIMAVPEVVKLFIFRGECKKYHADISDFQSKMIRFKLEDGDWEKEIVKEVDILNIVEIDTLMANFKESLEIFYDETSFKNGHLYKKGVNLDYYYEIGAVLRSLVYNYMYYFLKKNSNEKDVKSVLTHLGKKFHQLKKVERRDHVDGDDGEVTDLKNFFKAVVDTDESFVFDVTLLSLLLSNLELNIFLQINKHGKIDKKPRQESYKVKDMKKMFSGMVDSKSVESFILIGSPKVEESGMINCRDIWVSFNIDASGKLVDQVFTAYFADLLEKDLKKKQPFDIIMLYDVYSKMKHKKMYYRETLRKNPTAVVTNFAIMMPYEQFFFLNSDVDLTTDGMIEVLKYYNDKIKRGHYNKK